MNFQSEQNIPKGTSCDIDRLTWAERGVALVKKLRYLRAKVRVTAWFISMMTASSSLSALAFCANFTFPARSTIKFQNQAQCLKITYLTYCLHRWYCCFSLKILHRRFWVWHCCYLFPNLHWQKIWLLPLYNRSQRTRQSD